MKYYSLAEITNMGHLKSRILSDRVKQVYQKYNTNSELIFKKNNKWFISEKILHEFGRKQERPGIHAYSVVADRRRVRSPREESAHP